MEKIFTSSIKFLSLFCSALFFFSCAVEQSSFSTFEEPPPKIIEPVADSPVPTPQPKFRSNKLHQIFFDVINLGYDAVNSENFQKVIGNLSKSKNSNPIVVVKVDELPLGVKIGQLSDNDLAIENGIYKGLLNLGYPVVEKLDHLGLRDPSEFINTTPSQGFYMHPIDINAHNIIKKNYGTNLLLEYQIIRFNPRDDYLLVYFRLVDIDKMKILGSELVEVGENKEYDGDYELTYDKAYQSFKNIDLDFDNYNNMAILDLDILNIDGKYSNYPSTDLMAIENGIISAIIDSDDNYKQRPYINEKTEGFYLKYPEIYTNIVFNTNPLLYEEWDEFMDKTQCTEILLYRLIQHEGIYIRIIDAERDGKIIYSDIIPFKQSKSLGITKNHNFVEESSLNNFDFKSLAGKSVIIIDGDKHPLQPKEYIEKRKTFNEMHMAIEEGFISALVKKSSEKGFSVKEKLKTLYLKQPWMYDEKVFYLNPLYLDNWNQLKEYGADIILLYNNLISYEELANYQDEYKKVAISYRWIDVNTGQVMEVNKLTNDYEE